MASNYRTATFTITAKEENKGISRIEIWLQGEKIDTIPCNNETIVTKDYTVKRNGIYTVKAYADLAGSDKTTVEGVMPSIDFMPNGSTEWKKEHTSKIQIRQTTENVVSMKYKWTNSVLEPDETEFTESCNNNSIIKGKDFTGKYYLWILLETDTGKKNICGSEMFYFDNQAPNVEATPTPLSENSFKIETTASDTQSGIAKYEFYVDEKLEAIQSEGIYTWNGSNMGEKDCYVIVTDNVGNFTKKDIRARTLMHSWNKYDVVRTYSWTSSRISYTGYIDWLGFDENGNGYVIKDGASSITKGCGSCSLRGYVETNKVTYTQPRWCGDSNGSTWECGSETDPVENIKLTSKSSSKGESLGIVYDKDINKYPEDGESGDFWYVYDGLK